MNIRDRRWVKKAIDPFFDNEDAPIPCDRRRWQDSMLPGGNLLTEEHIDWVKESIDDNLADKQAPPI